MKTKADLIKQVCENTALSKGGVEQAVNEFLATLISELEQGNDVRIYELGTFKTAVRKAHKGRNPSTGEAIDVPQKYVPQLKFNQSISRVLNTSE